MVVGGLDITDKLIRARQKEPDMFEPGSFRTIRLAPGVKAIIGRLKGEKSTTTQSILFDKAQYTPEQAKAWLKRNNSKFSDAIAMEEEKVAMFELTLQDHLGGHLPPLSERQIFRLLEVAGPADDEEDDDEEDDMPHDEEEYVSNFVKRI